MSTRLVHLESLQDIVIIGRQKLEEMKVGLAFKKRVFETAVMSDTDRAKLANSITITGRQINEFRRALNRHEIALATLAEGLGIER